MSEAKLYCEECGAVLPADARFCEQCGTSAPFGREEPVIGHLPAERIEKGKGRFSRTKFIQVSLVITTTHLLCLRETETMNENWLAEEERLNVEEEKSGLPWRELIDRYDWRSPLWSDFYNVPPGTLLSAHRDNEAIPLADVVSATITLDNELDELDLLLTSGQTLHFQLFNLVGRAAGRFLCQALGPERVRLIT
jgi:hypothetical protein